MTESTYRTAVSAVVINGIMCDLAHLFRYALDGQSQSAYEMIGNLQKFEDYNTHFKGQHGAVVSCIDVDFVAEFWQFLGEWKVRLQRDNHAIVLDEIYLTMQESFDFPECLLLPECRSEYRDDMNMKWHSIVNK